MEAIIRTNDLNAFNSLIQFLKTMNFEVDTKSNHKGVSNSVKKITRMTLSEFYERNMVSQKEIAEGKLITQNDAKKHFERKSR